jgi:hypothetical protein
MSKCVISACKPDMEVSTCQLKICFNVYCLGFVELLAVQTTLCEIVIKVTTTKYLLKGMGSLDSSITSKRLDKCQVKVQSIHLLGNFLFFLYCSESVLFFLILNLQSGRFEFVKKFDIVRL